MTNTIYENDPNYENFVAFEREREELIKDYDGQFIAYHDGKRIALGEDKEKIYQTARKIIPKGLVLLIQIGEERPNLRLRTTNPYRISDSS